MRFRLNGRSVATGDVDSTTTLIEVLRSPAIGDMTPKQGCALEQCGACRVLLDGVPAHSCTLAAGVARDRHVETAAGLDTPVRRALIDANATQCGFCLPGIVVAAEALFRIDPHPDRSTLAKALDPQLCRCGSQPRVLRALERLAQG